MSSYVDELSCAELVELVTEYLEEALSDDARTRFELHVLGCAGCNAHLAQMRTTVHVLRALAQHDEPADESLDALVVAFRGWKQRALGSV